MEELKKIQSLSTLNLSSTLQIGRTQIIPIFPEVFISKLNLKKFAMDIIKPGFFHRNNFKFGVKDVDWEGKRR